LEDDKTIRWSEVGTKHQSLNTTIYEALRQAIFQGEYKPGEKLTEPGLAKLFGVSRNPIREVLRRLQSEGIVEIPPRKSARVTLFTTEEIEEIIELRAELEGLSAQFATSRLVEETRVLFQNLLEEGNKAEQQNDISKVRQCNSDFHALLASSGKNRFLADYMRTLREKTLWLFEKNAGDRCVESWREHRAVIEAVMSSDKKLAGLLAARHVRRVGSEILDVMKQQKSLD